MRIRMAFIVSAALSLFALTGCDPFETEITINANGSGRVVQKGRLSPTAHQMLRQYGGPRLRGFRPILTEEAAKKWSESQAQTGLKLTAYSSTTEEDGSLRFSYELSFSDLKEYAGSVWAWPLQLGATETVEGTQLQIDDPVRFTLMSLAASQAATLTPPPKVNEPGGMEYMAFRDAVASLSSGLRVKTVVHLPAAPRRVEEGALARDGQTLACERLIGDGKLPWTEWLMKKPMVAVLPAGALTCKFFTPAPPVGDRPVIMGGTADVGAAQGFQFKLTGVNVSRTTNFEVQGAERNPRAQGLTITLALACPEAKLLPISSDTSSAQGLVHMLSAAKDDQGNDLRSVDAALRFYTAQPQYYGRGEMAPNRDRPAGYLTITLKLPAKEVTALSLLEGYVAATQVVEDEKTELKPLRDYLNRDFDTGNETFRFTAIKGTQVETVVTRRTNSYREMGYEFTWYAPDGTELPRGNWNSRGGDGFRTNYQVMFNAPFPEDGGVSFVRPVKLREVHILFSFKDVKLP